MDRIETADRLNRKGRRCALTHLRSHLHEVPGVPEGLHYAVKMRRFGGGQHPVFLASNESPAGIEQCQYRAEDRIRFRQRRANHGAGGFAEVST